MLHEISIIIPVFNEEESLNELIDQLDELVNRMNEKSIEIIFIDDGSNDNTNRIIVKKTKYKDYIKLITLIRNFGQTAAISAGIDNSNGKVLITMDSDLQNSCNDIPKLIKELDKGFDVVSGWRKKRRDGFFTRVLPSKIANWIISKISGVHLHDYGCTLKAYKKEILEGVKLYGEMHRFIPIYIYWQGGRITEMPVAHNYRKYGKSKYGLSRTFSVIADLILLKFMEKQLSHPIHLFGGFAILNFFLSIICFLLMLYFKYSGQKTFIETPLPELVILFIMVGVLSLFMGFIAEILMRTYFESQDRKSYSIK